MVFCMFTVNSSIGLASGEATPYASIVPCSSSESVIRKKQDRLLFIRGVVNLLHQVQLIQLQLIMEQQLRIVQTLLYSLSFFLWDIRGLLKRGII